MLLVPRRSIGGCFTCKRRKKKCDETRPVCSRCAKGDFACLGYDQQNLIWGTTEDAEQIGASATGSGMSMGVDVPSTAQNRLVHLPTLGHRTIVTTHNNDVPAFRMSPLPLISFPASHQLGSNTALIDQVVPLVISQYVKSFRCMAFKMPPRSIDKGLLWRINNSDIVRWSMFLGSKIMEELSNGNDGLQYLSWIHRFYQHVVESSSSSNLALPELRARLSAIDDITGCVYMISGTLAGYSLQRHTATIFLQLATQLPELWTETSAISITAAVKSQQYETTKFVIGDTINSFVLGTPPLIYYDTSALWVDGGGGIFMQWIYGFPAGFVALIAKVNSWRVLQMSEQPTVKQNEWQQVESHLKNWNPEPDRTDEVSQDVIRLAVQECWRHATLIYLYMGMCGVSSADPRVDAAVCQIVQLSGTIEPGTPLELHALIPCIVAGMAARRERHRASMRKILSHSQIVYSIILREKDFVPVLDSLWHGAASDGRPILWDDYVRARSIVMPIALW